MRYPFWDVLAFSSSSTHFLTIAPGGISVVDTDLKLLKNLLEVMKGFLTTEYLQAQRM